ncbi:MAG: lysophospholipid acyltransferase family protein [Stellaceae bacterium]
MSFARPAVWRRLLRHPRLRRAGCWAIHCYIRLVYRTNRWQIEGGEAPRRLLAEGRVFIGAFWHGRMLMIPMAWQRMAPMRMLISAHRDGRIIADAVSYFGIEAIAGSTRRGGSAALRSMLKNMKAGACVAITPDGPSGPAMRASLGIVNLARLAQVPILPVSYATSRRRVLANWDRFHVALPFGHGVFLWGEPIEIGAELDEPGLERARLLIETRMIEMVEEADRRVGHAATGAASLTTRISDEGAGAPVSRSSSEAAGSSSPSSHSPRPSPASAGGSEWGQAEGWDDRPSLDRPVLYDEPS